MNDSIVNSSTMYKKTFTYVPPTPPSELIDSSNYTLNFVKRKIFSLMGNILSFILEQPGKYKRTIFIETDKFKLSSMMYTGENVL
ncbi:Uncharacterized protein FWK35_00022204, partial [Aphis craccivora]